MIALRLAFSFVFAAGFGFSQSTSQLEIRGTVVESGFPVGGATVTLYEFGSEPAQATTRSIFATTITDPRGAFRFQPSRLGQYYLEVKREGYFSADFERHGAGSREEAGDSVSLDRDHPSREFRFSITRLGELRGRIIDENGEPMKRLRVVVHPREPSSQGFEEAITDAEGFFVVTRLRPREYLVRTGPQRGAMDILSQFSGEDLKVVDQDLETAEWPGGGDERSASPVPVGPGSSLSVGTITVRKSLYYRAHVSVVPGECLPGEKWTFAAIQPAGPETAFVPTRDVACTQEFLVRNLKPGSYMFALTSGRDAEKNKWAAAPVEIGHENVEVALTMSPGADLNGRIIAAEGAELPPRLAGLRVVLTPDVQGFADFVLFGTRPASPDAAGRFLIKGLQGDRHRVFVEGTSGKYYVKEIRYSGLPAVDGIITTAAGTSAELEILVDDKAASVSGVVTNGDKPFSEAIITVVKWPVPASDTLLSVLMSANVTADEQGRFRVDGLAPGEYRALALPRDVREGFSPEALVSLVSRGEKITVERGSSQSVSLRIVEP